MEHHRIRHISDDLKSILFLDRFDAIMTSIIDSFKTDLDNTYAQRQEECIVKQKQYNPTISDASINYEDNNHTGEEESTRKSSTTSIRGRKVPTDSIHSYRTLLPISTCNISYDPL